MAKRSQHVELKKSRRGKWYFHLKGANGEVMNQSQGYSRRDSARRGARRNHPGVAITG